MRLRAMEIASPAPSLEPPRGWRGSIRALGATLTLVVLLSLVAAAGVPREVALRVALVAGAWTTLALLVAYLFLPGFHLLPWRVTTRVPRRLGPRTLALTFDDGPHPDTTPGLLAALAAANVKATFFLVGEHVRRWPELARRIAAEGHAIGNHTQRHRLLVFRTQGQLEAEIAECEATLRRELGVETNLFRPPHGFKPVGLGPALRRHALRMVAWQGSVRDTDAPGPEAIAERILRLARPRRILLLHDNPTTRGQTAQALAAIAAGVRERGLEFVRLDDGE